jgi:5-formyltetrahydrofolate cyclo-ligase
MTVPTADGRQFTLGKYEIRAAPIAGSAHMLRYTVFMDGKRIGSMASMPSESDCQYLEKPPAADSQPIVPFFQHAYRPPKKPAPLLYTPRAARKELPHAMALPQRTDER